MTTKKFLIQFTSDAQTRWLNDDAQIAHALEVLARSVAHASTAGTVPDVSAIKEEAPCTPPN